MNAYHETLTLPADTIDRLEALCRGPAVDCGRDETIFDREVRFDDGCRMAIQVVAPNAVETDSCWTQGVLFDAEGHELGCTEVGESVAGSYEIEHDGNNYEVDVMDDSRTTLLTAAALALEALSGDEMPNPEAFAAYAADLGCRLRQLAREIE